MPIKTLSAAEAFAAKRADAAKWPKTPEEQEARLKPFCLPELSPSFQISETDPIFTIGSCFARNIEKQLIIEGFNALAAQFPAFCAEEGVEVKSDTLNKFVAGSILNELKWALDPEQTFDERSIVQVRGDRYVDMQLAPGMLPVSMDQILGIRRAVSKYMALIKDARVVIITLGLAEAWYDRETGLYLNSPPHKGSLELFPDRFEVHVLDYNDIVSALEGVMETLGKFGRPDVRVILTVSPVALGATWTGKDAIIANTYSKAVQRAAAEFIVTQHENVDYMPSYESVTLSDRDMAWRDDGAHASDEAVRVNVLRMLGAYTGRDVDLAADQERAVQLYRSKLADRARRAAPAIAEAPQAEDVLVSYRQGRALYDAGDFDGAAAALQKSRSLGGDHYGAAYLLGKALFRANRFEEAITALKDSLAFQEDPTGPQHLIAKATAILERRAAPPAA